MVRLQFLERRLRGYAVYVCGNMPCGLCPDQVELLGGQTSLTADHLYIGMESDLDNLGQVSIQAGTLILTAGATVEPCARQLPDGCTVLGFSCTLAQLYNTVASAISRERNWKEVLRQCVDRNGSPQNILTEISKLTGRAALLLDRNGRVMVSAGVEKSAYLTEQMALAGVMSQQTMQKILPASLPSGEVGRWDVPQTRVRICGCRLEVPGDAFHGALILEGCREDVELDLYGLCGDTADALRRVLSRSLSELPSDRNAFDVCWEQIAERKLTNAKEIRDALIRMPHPVKQFVRVGYITFAGGGSNVPYQYLMIRLRELLPDANITIYRKNIVMLMSDNTREFQMELEKEPRLTELLNRYDGFLAVSNQTRKLDSLYSCFLLTRRTAFLGQMLRFSKEERVFYHENYSMYNVIDLCVQRYLETEGNEDCLYLIHPAIVLLTRYDLEHNNNLRDVLYYYLLHDRNLVKTAAATYMHRNTVINKVNKIMELLGMDLEDPGLRQRLIFSCQFIRYYELVLQQEFRP